MLRHQRETLIVTLVTLAATIGLYVVMPKGFLPLQDTGLITAVTEAGTDVSFDGCSAASARSRTSIRADPDVTGVVSVIGVSPLNATPNAGRIAISLKPRDQRHDLVGDDHRAPEGQGRRHSRHDGLFPGRAGHPDFDARVARAVPVHAGRHRPRRGARMGGQADAGAARRSPALREVASEAQEGGPRVNVQVDREQAGRLGVSMQSVTDTLNDAFGQRQISTIYGQANQYRVILEAQPRFQQDPSALSRIYVTGSITSNGTVATVANTATGTTNTNTTATPNAVTGQRPGAARGLRAFRADHGAAGDRAPGAVPVRHHQLRSRAGLCAVRRGRRHQRGASRRSACRPPSTAAIPATPPNSSSSLGGEPLLILAAAIAIYIVLGVLYESFIHPLTILSTLPSAGVGALLALMLFGYDLSVIALIGIVLLMGIVKKNAILMIDFALEAERKQGLSPEESIVQAALLRFRPIMMTTLAALFGALPLALEMRHRLGAAQSARRHHRRRPAAQPIADALHHAGDLSLHGAAARAADAGVPPRRGRARARAGAARELLAHLHPPADRHHAAGDRAVPGRRGRLHVSAGRQPAERRLATISVTASRPGADPNTMAATVAAPLERRLARFPASPK